LKTDSNPKEFITKNIDLKKSVRLMRTLFNLL
jgi:hypothetical protein